jgi:trehalose 6-phosphate phosphatase
VKASLGAALTALARRTPLLVALDFDGVLAPLQDDPARSRPLPLSVRQVHRLLGTPGVTVAYVSGRALADLRAVATADPRVILVGSHGSEWGPLPVPASGQAHVRGDDHVTPVDWELLGRVASALDEVAATYEGTRVERKPTSVVLHSRLAEPPVAAAAQRAALAALARFHALHVIPGKDVIEAALTDASKGRAVADLRAALGCAGVLFVGDDITDETVFVRLAPPDVGVRVGAGQTAAQFRVDGPNEVADVLSCLADALGSTQQMAAPPSA